MGFNWSQFFASGVEELGETAVAKDVKVSAEAKAYAEENIKNEEEYQNTITANEGLLKAEVEQLQALGIKDVGKIRTVMKAYGNKDVIKQLEENFKSYLAKAELKQNDGKFTTLKEYINGKLKPQGILSDEAAEQAEDEAVVAGEVADIQKAEKKAKAMGVDLQTYLRNQAIKMTDRPAFNLEARAARLVEESKMGLFGKTLTLEEAKNKIISESRGISPVAPEAKDLGQTGFTFDRETPLTAAEIIKLRELKDEPSIEISQIESLKNSIARSISDKFTVLMKDGRIVPKDNDPGARKAMLAEIEKRLKTDADLKKRGGTGLSKDSINKLKYLKEQYELGNVDQTKELPTITTQEEYDKLPEGAEYKDKTGKKFKKKPKFNKSSNINEKEKETSNIPSNIATGG